MRSRISLLVAILAFACAIPAKAQLNKEIVGPAETLSTPSTVPPGTVPPEASPAEPGAPPLAKGADQTDLLVVPIPISNPAIGTGLTVAAVLFYNPNGEPHPWISGLGAGYTSTKSWAGGAFHSMSLGHDKVRLLGFAGYGDVNVKFYGIGPEAGANGIHIALEEKAFVGLFDAQVRFVDHGFFSHFYAGGRLEYFKINSSADLAPANRPDLDLPRLELTSTLASVGPAITYDSRDRPFAPSRGVYVQGSWLFGAKGLGSDFTHNKLDFAANAYFTVGRTTVIGVRGQLCGVSGKAPFYDLCLFGRNGDLRGYETGRYRDGATWAVQGEVRQHLFGKFGVVGFGGVGGIAPEIGDIFKHSTVLVAGGGGLRYMASRSNNVNLRLDIAFGKDGKAVYFGIGEQF
jgi:hypothetical protein